MVVMKKAASVLLTILLLADYAPAQQRPRPTFRVSSETILVDVRVTDSKGRPVTGLKAEDFKVTEEGLPQEITYFQEISLPSPAMDLYPPSQAATAVRLPPSRTGGSATAAAPTAPAPAPTAPAPPPGSSHPAPDKRLLIILFNLSSLSAQDSAFMRDSAERFINHELTPNDLVAVALFDQSLQLLTDFTSDRQKLLGTLGYLDELDPEKSEQVTSDDMQADDLGEYIVDETEFDLFTTNRQLVAIQAIAEAFRDVPGRKSLVYFSGGLSLNDTETLEQVRETTDVANRANLSIYAVDARGLVAPSAGGGAQKAGGRGTGLFNGRDSLAALQSLANSQEGMTTLAEDTGGAVLLDDNDSIKIFRAAQEDSSHYYLLGYLSGNLVKDGKFRRIEVKVERPGVKVAYRRGYYADRPFIALTAVEKEQSLQQAVMEDRKPTDFPVELQAEYFPQPDGYYLVPTTAAFAFSDLRGGDPKLLSLDMDALIIARDKEGRVVSGVRDRVEIKAGNRATDVDFAYQNSVRLPPGQFQIQVYLRDNRTGRMTAAQSTLALPLPQALVFSSLALGATVEDARPAGAGARAATAFRVKTAEASATAVSNPLETAGKTLMPQNHPFRRTDPLYFQGSVLGKDLKAGDFRVAIVHSSGRRVLASQWARLEKQPDTPVWEYRGKLALGALAPGDYRLEVELRLDGAAKVVSREFRVE
jgi:VWFA-related protein